MLNVMVEAYLLPRWFRKERSWSCCAQSIGEPGTQLTLRTFHVGGYLDLQLIASVIIKKPGVIVIDDLRTINTKDEDGNDVELVISRSV